MSDEACYADDIGDYRWEGFSLEEKIGWMQGTPGSSAIQPGVDALRALSARYAESQRTVQVGLAKLGISWQGQSADAASRAVSRLAEWVAGPSQTASGGSASLGTYGASFNAMRPRIAPVAGAASPLTGSAAPTDGVGVLGRYQSPFSLQIEQVAAADARANAALRAHVDATRAALGAFTEVSAPPEVAAGTAPNAPPAAARARATSAAGGSAAPGVGGAGPASRGGTARSGSPAGPSPGGGTAITGAPNVGAGHHGGPAAGAGDTTAAGAGAPASPAPTDGGWTPFTPGIGSNGGPVTGPNGGLVPAALPPPYQSAVPGVGGPSGPRRWGAAGGSAGLSDGYGLPPRTGAPGPRLGGDFGVPQNAAGRAAGGPAGAAPMGMGAGARGGDERSHRNQTFIPDDEPFRVDFFDIAPPVLGVRDEEVW